MTTILIVTSLTATYLLIYILRSFLRHIRNRRVAKALGCKPVATIPSGILGISGFLRVNRAVREKQILENIFSRFQEAGSHTVEGNMLGNRTLMTIEPENIKAMLATQFSDFGLGSRHEHFFPFLGDGIFTLDGHGWSQSRAMLRPQFTREMIADFDQIDIHLSHLISLFPKDRKPFDIQDLFFRFTLDSATDFLFGEPVGSLALPDASDGMNMRPKDQQLNFTEAFNTAQAYCNLRSRAASLYWLINPKSFRDSIKTVHTLVDYYVDLAVQSQATSQEKSQEKDQEKGREKERYIFLEALAAETKDRKVLRDQLLNILLAGRDTTASLLSSVFYFLARDQAAWKKLREEIIHAFGKGKASSGITFSSLKQLTYLRYVVNETLRLLPPVPINFRVALNDTTVPAGGGPDDQSPVFLEKGTMVLYSVWGLHRRPDLWGNDADQFRPERWAERHPKNWDYLPFNGGPRICLGQQYALTEASYVIVKLLQQFDTIEAGDSRPDLIETNLTLSHFHGVVIRLYSSGEL